MVALALYCLDSTQLEAAQWSSICLVSSMSGFESHLSSSSFIVYGQRDIQVSCIYLLALTYVGRTVSM